MSGDTPIPGFLNDLFGLPPEPDLEIAPQKLRGDTADESTALGVQALTEGDYDKAIEHFKRSITQRPPGDEKGYLDLGGAYEAADRAPQAFRQYLLALKERQTAAEPHAGLANILKREGRAKDAVEKMKAAIEADPENGFLRFKLAELLKEQGYPSEALSAIRGAIAVSPADSFYHLFAAEILILKREWRDAVDALHAAIELSPGDDFLFFRVGAAFWGLGKQPEAIKALRLAGDLDPDKALYAGVLETLLRASGDIEGADAEVKRASKMDRLDRYNLDRFCEEVGLPFAG